MTVRRIAEQSSWCCPTCNAEFAVPAGHWSRTDCEWPTVDGSTLEKIVGMVLGDGHIEPRNTSRFVSEMTNRRFVTWLYDELGWLSTQAVRSKTAEEMYEKEHDREFYSTDVPEFRPVYRVATMGHPVFDELLRMYGRNGKIFPTDLSLTPELTRMWYVGDGTLSNATGSGSPAVQFEAQEQIHAGCGSVITKKFENVGFDARINGTTISIPSGQTEALLDWMGDAPPGFEYKWELDDPDRYATLKRDAYEPHPDDR